MTNLVQISTNYAIGTTSYIASSFGVFNETYFSISNQDNYIALPDGDFYPYVSYALLLDP